MKTSLARVGMLSIFLFAAASCGEEETLALVDGTVQGNEPPVSIANSVDLTQLVQGAGEPEAQPGDDVEPIVDPCAAEVDAEALAACCLEHPSAASCSPEA